MRMAALGGGKPAVRAEGERLAVLPSAGAPGDVGWARGLVPRLPGSRARDGGAQPLSLRRGGGRTRL